MKTLFFTIVIFLMSVCCLAEDSECKLTVNGSTFSLCGKVKLVDIGEDLKVKIVDIGEDLKVKIVDIAPDQCGKIKLVDIGEDFKVKLVDIGEDLKVKIVDIGEGVTY